MAQGLYIFLYFIEASQQGDTKYFEVLRSTMNERSKGDMKTKREELSFAFGPQFDLITDAWSNDTEALSLIVPTEEIIKEASAYVIHPTLIDACFQTILLLSSQAGKFVPQKITRVTILQKITCIEQFYAHTKMVGSEKTPTYNITLMDRYARPLIIIEKLIFAEISANKPKMIFENVSFTFGWEASTSETPTTSQDNVWLILRDQSKYADRFSQCLSAKENVHFVDLQDSSEKTREEFSEVLDGILGKIESEEKLLVMNFWPVDGSNFDTETQNFNETHALAFESCLSISQEIIKREISTKSVQLVFVTSGVVTIPQPDRYPSLDITNSFPWSATVLGFRRTFSEEITAINASVVDLPSSPNDDDFQSLAEETRKTRMEEEIVYRNGLRYVNRFKKLSVCERKFTKQEAPVTKDGVQKPFKLASISGQWFLQKTTEERMNGRIKIDIHFACPVLQKPWHDLKSNDRVAIAGNVCDSQNKPQDSFVLGICKIDDLGSYVDAEKCTFTQIENSITAQQAVTLGFPLVMSYHILINLINDAPGKNVLMYHENEQICCIFACVALSLGVKVVCLVKDGSSREQMKKMYDLVVLTTDEIARAELDAANSVEFDAVCLLSDNSAYLYRQVVKHLRPGAAVITLCGDENVKFNPFVHGKSLQCVMTNLESIIESSKNFEKLLLSCYSLLKSKSLFERLLMIPQNMSSVYDVMNNECKDRASEKQREIGLSIVSMKPDSIPEAAAFYSLPLDASGLKDDRTYLVIGGVRGFGFEVAKWMVKNGAKTIMCTARSAPSEEKRAEVQRLERETGSQILLRQADVTSWKDMNVIKNELESLPAVAGIVFTAMVLGDQLLINADYETCKKVVQTKVKGTIFITIIRTILKCCQNLKIGKYNVLWHHF